MFSFINRTVFDIPLTWDRTRFQTTRSKYRQARKLIEISINVQFEKQLKTIHLKNCDTEQNITEINEHLSSHEKKVHIFDNLTEIASESLSTHVDKRMENIRTIIQKHFHAIQTILQDENQYWKDIHSAIDQNLITSKDIHPCVQNTSGLANNNSPTPIEIDPSSSNENLITTKEERVSVVLPSINKTYVIKLEETAARSSSIESSPIYSQPNPPAQLNFSPTILQDEQSESLRNVLSPLDQNQINLMKPKVIIRRVGHTLLLDCLKSEENHLHHQSPFVIPETISKPQTHSAIKTELKPILRKRKQSVSEEKDTKSNTIALRKRKSVSIIATEERKPKKQRKKKHNKQPRLIQEPSPLPIIDRSKHYSTRFSPHSHRLNNFTLSTMNTESDDGTNQSTIHSRLRKKKI